MTIGPYCLQRDSLVSADFSVVKIAHKFGEVTLNGGVEYEWDIKIAIFKQCDVI